MGWTNKKPNSKTPPWIYRQSENRYHEDPIGIISKNYSTEIENNKKQKESEDKYNYLNRDGSN